MQKPTLKECLGAGLALVLALVNGNMWENDGIESHSFFDAHWRPLGGVLVVYASFLLGAEL